MSKTIMKQLSITAASGAGTVNTPNIYKEITGIEISPASGDSTDYSYYINTPNGNEVHGSVGTDPVHTGVRAEMVSIPMRGICTIGINDSTNDELFTIYLYYQDD